MTLHIDGQRFALIGAATSPRVSDSHRDTSNDPAAMIPIQRGHHRRYFQRPISSRSSAPTAMSTTAAQRAQGRLRQHLFAQLSTRRACPVCSQNQAHAPAKADGAESVNLDALREIEQETGCRVFTIHQLRLHPALAALKQRIGAAGDRTHDVDVRYVTSRGHWYRSSWKGDVAKSGGVATNIGLHLFDMLIWVFGAPRQNTVHLNNADCAAGLLVLDRARVRWFLSINARHLPGEAQMNGARTYRSVTVDGEAVEFSDGFTELHTESYRRILAGDGFDLDVVRPGVEAVSQIRNAPIAPRAGDYHPMCLSVNGV
jgi:hypothetical protein